MAEYQAVGGEASACCCTPKGPPACTRRGCFAGWTFLGGAFVFVSVLMGIISGEIEWMRVVRTGKYPYGSYPPPNSPNYTVSEYHDLKHGNSPRFYMCGCSPASYWTCTSTSSSSFSSSSAGKTCRYECDTTTCTNTQPSWYTPLDLTATFNLVNERKTRMHVHGLVGFGTFCSFVALVLASILGPCGGTKCFNRMRSSPRGVTWAYTVMLVASIFSVGMAIGSVVRYQNDLLAIVSSTIDAQNGVTHYGRSEVVATTINLAAAGYNSADGDGGFAMAIVVAVLMSVAIFCLLVAGACGWGWACCVSRERMEKTGGVGFGLNRSAGAVIARSTPAIPDGSGNEDGGAAAGRYRDQQQQQGPSSNPQPGQFPGQYPAGGAYPMMMMMPGPYGPGGYPMMPVNPGQPPPGAIPVPGQPGAYMVPMPYPGYPGAPVPPGQQPGPGGYASAYPQQPMPMMGAGQYPWPGQQPGPSPGQWAGWQQQPQPQQQDPDVPSKGNTMARRV